jgi:hypothetical protein
VPSSKAVDPAQGYENLPLSTRTTFNAVTHALLMTRLTGRSGESLSDSAMELVDRVDEVAGQILGSRGDRQFRIYVQMKPSALELLTRSKEFSRAADNTVYHKGYPICFRSTGGHRRSSSLSRATRRKPTSMWITAPQYFVALFNGHLMASNSTFARGNDESTSNSGGHELVAKPVGLPCGDASSGRGVRPRRPSRTST